MAKAEAAQIEGQSKVDLAKMNAEAIKIVRKAELDYHFKKENM